MKVIEKDRLAEQINAEGGGEHIKIIFAPNVAMFKILARFLPSSRPSRTGAHETETRC